MSSGFLRCNQCIRALLLSYQMSSPAPAPAPELEPVPTHAPAHDELAHDAPAPI